MKTFITLLLSLMFPLLLCAQDESGKNDSSITDSVHIYKKIKVFSSKRKWTAWLYGAIFIEPGKTKSKEEKKGVGMKKDNFNKYKGRTIRNIEIFTLDPFGANISDTTLVIDNKLINIGNKLHIKSKKSTIQNQLLFRERQLLDPYKLRESERILRSSAYVRDARISISEVKGIKDSVDIVIIVQDQWSITGAVSNKTLEVFDQNFLGLAHELRNGISYDSKRKIIFKGSYSVPYIRNTFITATAYYNTSSRNGQQGMSVGREFYSPLTKWAGGIDLIKRNAVDLLPVNDTLDMELPLKYYLQDYWGGVSFKLRRGDEDRDKAARLVATARIFNKNYIQRLSRELDTAGIYQNSTFYLASVGYSFRQYYKDKYIYRFGRYEDVPEGSLIALIGGFEKREIYNRYYAGIRATTGRHVQNFGYLSAGVEYGTYLHRGNYENGVLNLNFSYFSDLWSIKKWAMRQFVYYDYSNGIQRDLNERIDINGRNLYGLNSSEANGANKMTLKLENVLYTPFQLLGFHFATLGFAGFGFVGPEGINLFKGRLFQVYGLGLLIRNENLIINTFQLSFAVYPNLEDGTAFKFNPISSYQLRFNDFYLSKPDIIEYK